MGGKAMGDQLHVALSKALDIFQQPRCPLPPLRGRFSPTPLSRKLVNYSPQHD